MTLPPLPKQNKHKEADFGLTFREWIEKERPISSSLELKDTRGKDFLNFNELGDNQIIYAKLISGPKGALIRVQGTDGQPDYIWLRNTPSYVVIKYPKSFSMISVSTFLMEKERSKRKSLTEQRASEISVKTVKKTPTK